METQGLIPRCMLHNRQESPQQHPQTEQSPTLSKRQLWGEGEGHLSTRTRSLISHLFNTVISKGVFKCPGRPCSLPSRQAWKTAAVSHNPSSFPRSFSQAHLLKIRSFQSKLIPLRSNLLCLGLTGRWTKG